MKTLARWLSISAVCILSGCASTQQFQHSLGTPDAKGVAGLAPTNGKAKIFVLRKSGILGAAIGIRIADMGRPVGKVGPGGIVVWEREPGQVVIGASASNEANLTITVKEGEVYFLEAKPNWGAEFNTASCELRLLSSEEGLAMLARLQGKPVQ